MSFISAVRSVLRIRSNGVFVPMVITPILTLIFVLQLFVSPFQILQLQRANAQALPAAGSSEARTPVIGCREVEAFLVPGSSETTADAPTDQPKGPITGAIARALIDRLDVRINLHWVPYPADVVVSTPYDISRAHGRSNLEAMLRQTAAGCPDSQLVIIGFSQGADVVGEVASAIGTGHGVVAADRILAVQLFGDPQQGVPGVEVLGTGADGIGMLGPREAGYGELTDRVTDFCNTGDLYCDSPAIVRPVARAAGEMTVGILAQESAAGEVNPFFQAFLGFDEADWRDVLAALPDGLWFAATSVAMHLSYDDPEPGPEATPLTDIAADRITAAADRIAGAQPPVTQPPVAQPSVTADAGPR